MTDQTYTKEFIELTRPELIVKVQEQMSKKRFTHVLGVEEAAVELAVKYGVSVEAASIAALTHDYAKERDDKEMQEWIIQKNMDRDLLHYGSNIWHGPVGAEIVKQELGVVNEDILNAIRHHTVGACGMSLLEQIIYVADFIEPGRSFQGVEEARRVADKSLEATVAYITSHTLQHLILSKRRIYPKTVDTYNAWVVRS